VKKTRSRDRSWEQAGIAAAALLGAVWATTPLLFVSAPAAESRYAVVALLFAAKGVGTLALATNKSSASVFCAMLTGVSAVTAASAATPLGYALCLFAIAYGAAIIMVSGMGRKLVADALEARHEVRRRDGIITLSLKEDAGTLSSWIFETQADGCLTSASSGLSAIAGVAPDELIGQPFSEVFPDERRGAGWNRLLLAISARQAADCAVELLADGRHLWWQVSCRPVLKQDGAFAGHTGVAHNITAERMARQRLGDERQQALAETSKTAQFMEDVTQEIRSPLNTVLGFAEILNSSAIRDLTEAERRTYNQLLLDSSRSLTAFIADVSDMVRLNRETLHLMEQEVDAAELAEIAMKFCSDAAESADVTILVNVFDGVELRCDAVASGGRLPRW
jgi:PAS domain S-box-containing protein